MTVLLSQRKESKSKVISYAYNIKSMLIKLMQRGLGINDYDNIVRALYITRPKIPNNIESCEYLISEYKRNINYHSLKLISDLNSANSIYPIIQSELELRRSYQDEAIIDCVSLKNLIVK